MFSVKLVFNSYCWRRALQNTKRGARSFITVPDQLDGSKKLKCLYGNLRKPRRASPKIFFKSKKIAKLLSNPNTKKLFLMPQNYWESENIFLNRRIFSNPTFIFWSINLSSSPKKFHKSENLLPNLEKFFEIGKKNCYASARYTVSGWKRVTKTTGHVVYVGLFKPP